MERACVIFDQRVYCTQQDHELHGHFHGRFAECIRQPCGPRNEGKTPHLKNESEEWTVVLSRVAHDRACCRRPLIQLQQHQTKPSISLHVSSATRYAARLLFTRNGITCPVCVSLPNNFKQNAYILVCLKTHYMYRQFNIQQFYVMPTHCIYVFCVDLRTNSDCFPIQH
jgi:hypothetical protein